MYIYIYMRTYRLVALEKGWPSRDRERKRWPPTSTHTPHTIHTHIHTHMRTYRLVALEKGCVGVVVGVSMLVDEVMVVGCGHGAVPVVQIRVGHLLASLHTMQI